MINKLYLIKNMLLLKLNLQKGILCSIVKFHEMLSPLMDKCFVLKHISNGVSDFRSNSLISATFSWVQIVGCLSDRLIFNVEPFDLKFITQFANLFQLKMLFSR